MQSTALFLMSLGGILLLGLLTSALGQRTFLPRVTLLLVFGAVIGPDMLDVIPAVFSERFEIIANMALLMVGFLLGGRLTFESLRDAMRPVLWISLSAALVTTMVVGAGLVWAGVPLQIAILLGCIASATAPAAILDVVMESDYRGPFADLLLSIVALDDAWALVLFALGIAVVSSLNSDSVHASMLLMAARDIGGAVLLGALLGFPAAYLTGRLKPGQPILTEALGIVFVCGGLAIWFEVSFLIAAMVLGVTVANFARHHEYPFHAIEGVEWPFMVIFFVLAGASLELQAAADAGLVGSVYIFCRVAGKLAGAGLGARLGRADRVTRSWMGSALLPQAGVSIGMGLVASNYFPEYRQTLLSVVIGSTVCFEVIGPVFTRLALRQARRASAEGS
jgi:Kef-type K+ transport system membrane component KefB